MHFIPGVGHFQPGSRVQVEVQPSPSMVLVSSQPSPTSMLPSPQRGLMVLTHGCPGAGQV
jgi:hypothetical protein